MSTASASASAPDRDEIVRVVQLYVDGFQGDIAKFREAFHQDAWIFFTQPNGDLYKRLISECFEEWVADPEPIVGRILSVTQAGDIASVLLGFDSPKGPSDSWVDFHTLLRINGTWKITNKTATHNSRAAWAGSH